MSEKKLAYPKLRQCEFCKVVYYDALGIPRNQIHVCTVAKTEPTTDGR